MYGNKRETFGKKERETFGSKTEETEEITGIKKMCDATFEVIPCGSFLAHQTDALPLQDFFFSTTFVSDRSYLYPYT